MFRRSFSAKIVALLLLVGGMVAAANFWIIELVDELVRNIAQEVTADYCMRDVKRIDGQFEIIDRYTAELAQSAEQMLDLHWADVDTAAFHKRFERASDGTLISRIRDPQYKPDEPATFPDALAAHGPKESLYRPSERAKKFLLIAEAYGLAPLKLAVTTLEARWAYLLHEEVSVTYPFADQVRLSGADFLNSTRPYYDVVRNFDGKGRWTDPYLDANGTGWMITRAHPVLFRGKPFGAACQDVNLGLINRKLLNIEASYVEIEQRRERRPVIYSLVEFLLGKLEAPDAAKTFLIKKDGQVLTTNDPVYLDMLTKAGGSLYLWGPKKPKTGKISEEVDDYGPHLLHDQNGRPHARALAVGDSFLVAYPLNSTGWYVLIDADGSLVQAMIGALRLVLIIVTICGVSIAIALGYFFSHRFITSRILTISQAAERVAEGNLHARVKGLGEDEIGRLAKTFNRMMEGLLARQREREVFGQYVSTTIRDRILSKPEKLSGEEVEAVILFSDIRGFSSYTEDKPPQEVVHMLNRHFSGMVAVIQENHGVVDKFMGDCVMAVFGEYLGNNEPHRSAVKAAVGMREQLKILNEGFAREGKPPIEIGIGVHSGPVVAGEIGSYDRKHFTVIGNTVDIAARLESETKVLGHPILVSAQVRERCGQIEGVRFIDTEEIQVKGKTRKIRVFRVEPSDK